MIRTKLASSESELTGIRLLQSQNLRRNLSATEAAEQGFLIAEYTQEYLRSMNAHRPAVIALDGDQVVGYALAAAKSVREGHPFLSALFDEIDRLHFGQEPLTDIDYVVVGQLCISKAYRSQGLVQKLYGLFRESLQPHHRYAITDIARANTRSLQAHRRTGFQVIHSLDYGGQTWDVVLWDWATPAAGAKGVLPEPHAHGAPRS